MIVGATGSFWAHEKWNLATPPDFVTFSLVASCSVQSSTELYRDCSKKMQAAGFYHAAETRASHPYRKYVLALMTSKFD